MNFILLFDFSHCAIKNFPLKPSSKSHLILIVSQFIKHAPWWKSVSHICHAFFFQYICTYFQNVKSRKASDFPNSCH